MKCKYCEEGLVVAEVIYDDQSHAEIRWVECNCCNGNYNNCENCSEDFDD